MRERKKWILSWLERGEAAIRIAADGYRSIGRRVDRPRVGGSRAAGRPPPPNSTCQLAVAACAIVWLWARLTFIRFDFIGFVYIRGIFEPLYYFARLEGELGCFFSFLQCKECKCFFLFLKYGYTTRVKQWRYLMSDRIRPESLFPFLRKAHLFEDYESNALAVLTAINT